MDHEEHKLAARKVAEVATAVRDTTTPRLATAAAQHAAVKASGSFAEAIATHIDLVLDRLSAATAAVADHLSGALPDAILLVSNSQQSTDDGNRRRLAQLDQ